MSLVLPYPVFIKPALSNLPATGVREPDIVMYNLRKLLINTMLWCAALRRQLNLSRTRLAYDSDQKTL
jgi:hypothetical protein